MVTDILSCILKDSKLRMLSYVAVGKISRRVPQLVTRDMSLLQNFFDAISQVFLDDTLFDTISKIFPVQLVLMKF